ncbi:GNAT family N-acetyltransferase [Sporosarcina sp. Te-1]|uniref:GNAT family N-acetyltransferase n=1 Tax=Sporosarcina sp. Te-1 TaxID=2818390 RepID=UPI001A9E81AE|nr:GNAT family N-acetyltransferase [Sporosarcina sp. Te-1]QTD41834.1 GNAT family N-acetyltransferase [Sporosarcina sp. Te-1]
MDIFIEPLSMSDFEALFEFEHTNRDFFEQMVPSRGDDYYAHNTFIKRNQALLAEQNQGLSYFYLIKDRDGQILGRMNVVNINQKLGSGHIGYRVGKFNTGKGIATIALKLLLDSAGTMGIERLDAKTTIDNIGSQKVLNANGFSRIATKVEAIGDGRFLSFHYYRWTSEAIV